MPEFPWEQLRRAPDVEAPDLQAYDATDVLLAERALALAATERIDGSRIVVIGDEFGAITLRLLHGGGLTGIRVFQDSITGRRALARNSAALGLGGYTAHELDRRLLAGAKLVLLQLPKALAELTEVVDAIARWAAPDVVLIAGGRVKHMTLAMNEVIGGCFADVQPQRAERKSRLIVASGAQPVPDEPPFPVFAEHEVPWPMGSATGGNSITITLAAHGGAFAGSKLDIGTRTLLTAFDQLASTDTVIDLGCGTGALAAAYALAHPQARLIATDRSAAAVRSARATMAANDVQGRVEVTHDDAGSEIPDASADVVLLNPPFHLGAIVHTGAATRLFEASARLLRPGGQLLAVWNSTLRYRPQLERLIGPTEQLLRSPKFTVTRSVRRPRQVSNR